MNLSLTLFIVRLQNMLIWISPKSCWLEIEFRVIAEVTEARVEQSSSSVGFHLDPPLPVITKHDLYIFTCSANLLLDICSSKLLLPERAELSVSCCADICSDNSGGNFLICQQTKCLSLLVICSKWYHSSKTLQINVGLFVPSLLGCFCSDFKPFQGAFGIILGLCHARLGFTLYN